MEELKKAQRPLLVVHQNPDGDALGSAVALQEYLITQNKNCTIWSSTPIHEKYTFLPHIYNIQSDPNYFAQADLLVILDSGDLKYAGVEKLVQTMKHRIINIDHHPTNQNYGKINLVLPTVSSTSEIIFNFFRRNNIVTNHRMATALLTGLITDTDNFSNPATSVNTFLVASQLVRAGGNLNLINQWIVKNKTINSLRLWGAVLSRLEKIEKKNIIYTYITKDDLLTFAVADSESEGIANFLNNMAGEGVCLLLKEVADGKIKGSFRTTRDDIDVAAWAKTLGGGGHKKAAGFTSTGTIDEILEKILTIT